MLSFWETKMRNRMVFTYSFAPFLEEAGTLLFAADQLWHPWSVKRKVELRKAAFSLKDRARDLRQRGLAWASNISEFGQSPAELLSRSTYYRYHGDQPKTACPKAPKAAPYLVSWAIKLLFVLLPGFQKVEEEWYEEDGWVKNISEIIEMLMEAPYSRCPLEISEERIKTLGFLALLNECEGLAYMQASIEDSYYQTNKKERKKKKSSLSEMELRKLARELDMPFEVLKETFETEYSSWWQKSAEYRELAVVEKEKFLSSLPAKEQIKTNLKEAWKSGTTSQINHPKCRDENSFRQSEKIIKSFIAMFLFFMDNKELGQKRKIGPAKKLIKSKN